MTSLIGVHRPLCPSGRAATYAGSDTPCAPSARPYVLAATILASAMAFIDGSIVTIALPALQADLDAAFASLQWIVNGYALLLGGLILVGGAAGDRFGRRRVFIVGLAAFGAASLACAAAPSIQWLILGRAAQGIGAALLVPQSLAIIAAAFPRDIRGKAIGLWAGASAITTALGPPLGGILIDSVGWRSVFWINLPLCAAALWLTATHVPESRDDAAHQSLDWLGGAVGLVAFGALTAGLTVLAQPDGTTTGAIILLGSGVAGLVALLRIERSAANPLIPLSLFASRGFIGANLVTLLVYGALSAALFLLPFDLIERRGLSAIEVGFTLLPFGLIIGIASRHVGAWADRVGPRGPLVLGSALLTLASTGFTLDLEGFLVGVLTPVLVMSVGMALVAAPLTTAVMNAAPDSQSGAASGVNNAASRLAGLFAVAIVGAAANLVFFAGIDAATASTVTARFGELPPLVDPARPVVEAAFVDAYRVAMALAAAGGLSATLIAALFVPGQRALSGRTPR
jgi:EmrB/QacA subfamily drug resistance transporter